MILIGIPGTFGLQAGEDVSKPELLAALKAAKGPGRELDAEICTTFNEPESFFASVGVDDFDGDLLSYGGGGFQYTPPWYTASIDDALAFAERMLPGWTPSISAHASHCVGACTANYTTPIMAIATT